jgi:hypothetical protein
MAGPTGLEPATSGVTGAENAEALSAKTRKPAPMADSDDGTSLPGSVRDDPQTAGSVAIELDLNSSGTEKPEK